MLVLARGARINLATGESRLVCLVFLYNTKILHTGEVVGAGVLEEDLGELLVLLGVLTQVALAAGPEGVTRLR